MKYGYDLEEIKENLTEEQVIDLLGELGGEPSSYRGSIVSKTICHCGDSHKLYYYDNTKLFHCYTGCETPSFDIFELVRKVKSAELKEEYSLPKAVDYVAKYFGFARNTDEEETTDIDDYLLKLNAYDRIKNIDMTKQEVQLKTYEGKFLENMPQPGLIWQEEGITKNICDKHNIRYNPVTGGIVIPHYDNEGKLIGIRERELDEERINRFGKYHPGKYLGQMYNHPLSFALYNLNYSKDNIKRIKKAIVFEGEKSCLKYGSWYPDNDISVACTGSNLISYQVKLLIDAGAEEIIVGMDKQFKEKGDKEFKKLTRNLKQIATKYGNYVKISFLFDKWDILGYKEAPVDRTKEDFEFLLKHRVNLY